MTKTEKEKELLRSMLIPRVRALRERGDYNLLSYQILVEEIVSKLFPWDRGNPPPVVLCSEDLFGGETEYVRAVYDLDFETSPGRVVDALIIRHERDLKGLLAIFYLYAEPKTRRFHPQYAQRFYKAGTRSPEGIFANTIMVETQPRVIRNKVEREFCLLKEL